MNVAALSLYRQSGRPAVSVAMLCLLFLTCAPERFAIAAVAGRPISGSAVTPNSLSPGLGGYPLYPGGGGGGGYPGYPGSSYPGYPGSSYPGYPGSSYPGYPGSSYAGYPGSSYPGYTGGSAGYPGGSTSVDACTLCYWRNNYLQWYRQVYATYEQMGYDPCLICSYSYYGGR
ncbi:hypothetical protein R5R35_012126 [Gryllus longicercus]|uniref:Accessory gland protein n=1 Tax=Gryllus longicercus TaxID=2509291 RepID=A0AAN9WLJ7_9ORTH